MKLTLGGIVAVTVAQLCLVHRSTAESCDTSKLNQYREVEELAAGLPANWAAIEAKLEKYGMSPKMTPEGDCLKAALDGMKTGYDKSTTKSGHVEALLKKAGYIKSSD
jgi:hypothetical protein